MRIVAGKYGGRLIEAPRGHRTHPMSEKMRSAIFNALGDIEGISVLDALSGSGALALEAISRGAATALAIEIDKNSYKTIVDNVAKLELKSQIKAIRANASRWSYKHPTEKFDLVFIDPPYDAINESLLLKIAKHAKQSGVVVLSLPPNDRFNLPTDNYKKLTTKNYGDSELVFYRRIS